MRNKVLKSIQKELNFSRITVLKTPKICTNLKNLGCNSLAAIWMTERESSTHHPPLFGAASLDWVLRFKRFDNLEKLTEIVYDKFGVNLFQLATCAISIRHATGMNAGILPHLDIIHRVAHDKCLSWLNA